MREVDVDRAAAGYIIKAFAAKNCARYPPLFASSS